jgi:hypothetical protein
VALTPFVAVFAYVFYGAVRDKMIAKMPPKLDTVAADSSGFVLPRVVSTRTKNKDRNKRTVLMLILLTFSTVAMASFRAFVCFEVEGVVYLKEDMAMVCDGSVGRSVYLAFAVFGIVYVVIVVCLTAFFISEGTRKDVKSGNNTGGLVHNAEYGFLVSLAETV